MLFGKILAIYLPPLSFSSSANYIVGFVITSNHFEIRLGSGYTIGGTIYVTIQYTKSNDSAIAIGTSYDYSITEKVIGTWIDGKPLYQITINTGPLPNKTTKIIPTGLTNVDKIISLTGIATDIDGNDVWFTPLPKVGDYVTSTDNLICGIYFNTYDGTIQFEGRYHNNSNFEDSYVTIQYTKTTD